MENITIEWYGTYEFADEASADMDCQNLANRLGGEDVEYEHTPGGYDGPHSGTNPPSWEDSYTYLKCVVKDTTYDEVQAKITSLEQEGWGEGMEFSFGPA